MNNYPTSKSSSGRARRPIPLWFLMPPAMRRALTRIAHEIAERNEESSEVAMIGIQRGGVFLPNGWRRL